MAAETNSVPSSSASQFFYPILEKLEDSNFLLWRQQVEPVIKSHWLQRFVANPSIPVRFLTDADRDADNENPAYSAWEQQDQILLTWLQSTLTSLILSRVLGSVHSYQVWEKIHEYFHKQTRAKARQL